MTYKDREIREAKTLQRKVTIHTYTEEEKAERRAKHDATRARIRRSG